MSIPCPKCGAQIDVRLSLATPREAGSMETGGKIGELLAQINDGALNAWEQDFMGKLRERYEQYGERTKLSEKQEAIFNKIVRGE